jgi:hypothetical protein
MLAIPHTTMKDNKESELMIIILGGTYLSAHDVPRMRAPALAAALEVVAL